ncbi:hypothetical protein, partial [Nocardia cyriacigeorgica]|uniref:hypothetical protein n=1 Tax=Nocardia cyriacigeorgica TaxID=135487 RepID=UPI002458F6E7
MADDEPRYILEEYQQQQNEAAGILPPDKRPPPLADTIQANDDMIAALCMLDARHIVGDAELSNLLIGGVRREWRTGIRSRFDDLIA